MSQHSDREKHLMTTLCACHTQKTYHIFYANIYFEFLFCSRPARKDLLPVERGYFEVEAIEIVYCQINDRAQVF